MTDTQMAILLASGLSAERINQLSETEVSFILGHQLMHRIMRAIIANGDATVKITITFDAQAVMQEEWNDMGSVVAGFGRDIERDGARALGRWAAGDDTYMDGGYNQPSIKLEVE